MLIIFGLSMFYSVGHFFFLQGKGYDQRSGYEKAVTIYAIFIIVLLFIAILAD